MKLPVGFPFFNPPHIQKVTAVEEGNFFVPTQGVDGEMASKNADKARTKSGKIVKTVLIVLAAAAFITIGVMTIMDTAPLPYLMP